MSSKSYSITIEIVGFLINAHLRHWTQEHFRSSTIHGSDMLQNIYQGHTSYVLLTRIYISTTNICKACISAGLLYYVSHMKR